MIQTVRNMGLGIQCEETLENLTKISVKFAKSL